MDETNPVTLNFDHLPLREGKLHFQGIHVALNAMKRLLVSLSSAAFVVICTPSQATLLMYEPFDYPAGSDLAGQGGTGLEKGFAAGVDRSTIEKGAAMLGVDLDELLTSIAQLYRFLTGDSHVPLDAVVGLPEEATPAECVEALRAQVDEAIETRGLPPELERSLANVVATIG